MKTLQRILGILFIASCLIYNYMPDCDGTYILIFLPAGIALLFSQKSSNEWGKAD